MTKEIKDKILAMSGPDVAILILETLEAIQNDIIEVKDQQTDIIEKLNNLALNDDGMDEFNTL